MVCVVHLLMHKVEYVAQFGRIRELYVATADLPTI